MQHKHSGTKKRFRWLYKQQGFEFIEILVSLGLLSVLFVVLLTVQKVLAVQSSSYNKVVARQLLVEESEALRNASFAGTLQPYTGKTTTFLDVAYSKGNWAIAKPTSPQSSPSTYSVTGVTGTNDPSRALVPAGRLGDGTYDIYFRAQNSSAASWSAGFYFRYHDENNYYLLKADETTIALTKVTQGAAPVTVWTQAYSFTRGTSWWYQLTVSAIGSAINVSVNGTHQGGTPTATDTQYSTGQFVLYAGGNGMIDFDDVQFTNTLTIPTTLTWHFDGGTEVVGTPAYGWRGLSPADLPNGTTSVTLTDAQSGFTDIKAAVLTVSWMERNATRTFTNTFYLNQQSVPQ